jgi:hypothetical protein
MGEHIQNPRRAPRAPVRCGAAVISARGRFAAETEDVSAHGCRLASPVLVREGEWIQVVLTHTGMAQPLPVAARVVWATERAPWRLGVAFDQAAHPRSGRWFGALLEKIPGLSTFRRIPDQIAANAIVYLASPPRFLVDLTPDEVALLRVIGVGASVGELQGRLRDRWPRMERALFSVLAHGHATLSRGASVHPDAWKAILAGEAPPAAGSTAPSPAGAPAATFHLPMIDPRAWSRI